jgi:hypothetical protein
MLLLTLFPYSTSATSTITLLYLLSYPIAVKEHDPSTTSAIYYAPNHTTIPIINHSSLFLIKEYYTKSHDATVSVSYLIQETSKMITSHFHTPIPIYHAPTSYSSTTITTTFLPIYDPNSHNDDTYAPTYHATQRIQNSETTLISTIHTTYTHPIHLRI